MKTPTIHRRTRRVPNPIRRWREVALSTTHLNLIAEHYDIPTTGTRLSRYLLVDRLNFGWLCVHFSRESNGSVQVAQMRRENWRANEEVYKRKDIIWGRVRHRLQLNMIQSATISCSPTEYIEKISHEQCRRKPNFSINNWIYDHSFKMMHLFLIDWLQPSSQTTWPAKATTRYK